MSPSESADPIAVVKEALLMVSAALTVQEDGYTEVTDPGSLDAAARLLAPALTALEQLEEVVKAAKDVADATMDWNEAVTGILGRQPTTGIDLARLLDALQPFESTSEETHRPSQREGTS